MLILDLLYSINQRILGYMRSFEYLLIVQDPSQ